MRVSADVLQAIPLVFWRPGVIRSAAGAPVLWAPITRLASRWYCVGFTQVGDWVSECAEGLAALEAENSWYFLWSILERSPLDIRQALQGSLKEFPHADRILAAFPFAETVKHALTHGEGWAPLALDWIEKLEFAQRPQFIEALRLLVQDKEIVSQRTLCLAQRMLQQLSEGGG